MSEHLLKFLLSELDAVRVRCINPSCGVVVEISLSRLRHVFAAYECPACRAPFRAAGNEGVNWLVRLQEAIEGLRQADKQLQVQFVLPGKEQP